MAFWECFRQAWVGAAGFVRRRPFTVVAAIALFFACNVVSIRLNGAMPLDAGSKFLRWVIALVQLAAMIALSIQTMRYVMLDEHESRPGRGLGKPFWRYVGLSVIVGMGWLIIAALVVGMGFSVTHRFPDHFGSTAAQLVVWGLIAACIASFVTIRFSLLFCQVAIGRSMRWRAAWKDSRGHFWRIILSHILVALPFELCLFGVFALLRKSSGTAVNPGSPYLVAFIFTFFLAVGLIVASTCSSWLYRRYAQRLLENS
jgi:hypothetical protein